MKINITLSATEMAVIKTALPLKKEEYNDNHHSKALDAESMIQDDGGLVIKMNISEDFICESSMLMKSLYTTFVGLFETLKTLIEPFIEKWFNDSEDQYDDIIRLAESHNPQKEQLSFKIEKALHSKNITELDASKIKELKAILHDYALYDISRIESAIDNINRTSSKEYIIDTVLKLQSETLRSKFLAVLKPTSADPECGELFDCIVNSDTVQFNNTLIEEVEHFLDKNHNNLSECNLQELQLLLDDLKNKDVQQVFNINITDITPSDVIVINNVKYNLKSNLLINRFERKFAGVQITFAF